MKVLCIIPARGGSKRIPKKNIKDFLGKPIIYYSIKSAIDSNCFDEIMVSTDDLEIKIIAEQYGAKVPFLRSNENSQDTTSTDKVILEVIKKYREIGKKFNYICCLYPTTPLLRINNILLGLKELKKTVDFVYTVVPFSYPVERSLIMCEKNRCIFKYPKNIKIRTNDLEPHYHDAGQFYWFKTKYFLEKGQIYSSNNYAIVLNPIEAQDIDNHSDWMLAELKYKKMNSD